MSVVMTVLSLTASDVALLRPDPAEVGECKDVVDDIADVALPKWVEPWPL